MRTITHTAADVRELRRKLGLSQEEFAKQLGVTRRTIIRAEQRGIEIPWYSTSETRSELWQRWGALAARSAAVPSGREVSRDTSTIATPGKKSRDTLARIHAKVSRPRARA